MAWVFYNDDADDYYGSDELTLSTEESETAMVEFEEQPNGQLRIMFDLEKVRVHQTETGDVYVTPK